MTLLEPGPARRTHHRGGAPASRAWRVAAATALGAGAVLVLLDRVGFDRAGAALAQVTPGTVTAAVALQLVALAALVQVYRATYRVSGGRIGYREGAAVGLGAVSLTQLLPGGGVVGGLFATRRLVRSGADPVAAAATVVLAGLVLMGTLGVLVTSVTAVGAATTPGYTAYAIGAASATVVVLAAVLGLRAVLGRPGARDRVATWLAARRGGRGVLPGVATGIDTHRDLLRRPGVLGRPALWAAAKWTADLAVLTLVLRAVGAQTPLLAVLAAFAVANLAGGIPLTPGGLGVVELGATGTLVAFGTDPALAGVAVLGYRAVAIGVPLLLAVPALSLDARRHRRALPSGGHA